MYGDDAAGRFFMSSDQLDKVTRARMAEFHKSR